MTECEEEEAMQLLLSGFAWSGCVVTERAKLRGSQRLTVPSNIGHSVSGVYLAPMRPCWW